MSDSKFKVAGVSRQKGQVKVRFANDMTRVKKLVKDGQTDIELLDLPTEMTKPEAVKYLLTSDLMSNADYAAAISSADTKYSPTEKPVKVKAEKVAKVKAPKKEKAAPSISSLAARAKKEKTAKSETAEVAPSDAVEAGSETARAE